MAKISRKDFLKAAGAGAASIAVMGLMGTAAATEATSGEAAGAEASGGSELLSDGTSKWVGDTAPAWLGEKPEIPEEEIKQVVDVDVVVVGLGIAGCCAARSAAEEGASLALIERSSGAVYRSGQYAVLGGKVNEMLGRPAIDPDVVVDRFMTESGYCIKRSIISKWARNAGDVFDWFISAMPDMYILKTSREDVPDAHADFYLAPMSWPVPNGYDYSKEDWPVFPYSFIFGGSGMGGHGPIIEANLQIALDAGAQAFFYHRAELLKTDAQGRVTGVYARDMKEGGYILCNAKSVILATGDNGGNPEMVKYFCPDFYQRNIGSLPIGMDIEENKLNSGDGLKMGTWAEARICQHHAYMTHHTGGGIGICPFLMLNRDGRRFMNECVPGQQLESQLELQPGQVSYQLFDDGWREQISAFPPHHICYSIYSNETFTNYSDGDAISEADFEAAIENGQIQKADTLEELLDMLEIDKETALASIARYNELAKAGDDVDFNKEPGRMFPIETGPFYATTLTKTVCLVVVGGLESDEDCHTFNYDRDIIHGLYVCGNVQGNRYAREYPICMRGISHSLCMYYGYVAGKNAAGGV